jgi:hypothetical protein
VELGRGLVKKFVDAVRGDPSEEADFDVWEWLRATFLPGGRQRLAVALAWAGGIACLIALLHRFRLGADVSDESFAIALPYRFALGDKPFVDELSIQQTTGVMLAPFVWVYVKIMGGPTGIVLYSRFLHFVVKGLAGLCVYATARRWLKHRAAAIAVGFLPIAFVPGCIPNVGYNVLGMALLTAGTFLCAAAAAAEPGARFRLFFLGGLCQGLTAFAYPPMAPAPIFATLLVFVCTPNRRFAALGAFVAGGAAAAALTLPSLGFGGIAGVKRSLGPWGGVDAVVAPVAPAVKMKGVIDALMKEAPSVLPFAAIAVGIAWVLRSRSLTTILTVGALVAALLASHDVPRDSVANSHNVICVAFLAPILLLLARPSAKVVGGAVLVVGPSVVAGLCAGYSSSQGWIASAMGLHATMVLSALLAVRALEKARADALFCVLPPMAVMLALVVNCYDFVYRDGPLATLTETVKRGPFKGIRTTTERARAFAEYSGIIDRYGDPRGRTLVLYESPGYYLFSKSPPGAHGVWETPYGDMDGMLHYWQKFTNGHSIVIRIKGGGSGVLDPILTPRDRLIEETPHFVVYRDR